MKSTSGRTGRKVAFSTVAVALGLAMSLGAIGQANAYTNQPSTVDLGAASSFAVLGAETVTNTGPSTISGDVGLTAGTAITGFPPGVITGPYGLHSNTTAAINAKADLLIAYGDAESRGSDEALLVPELGGLTLDQGVYSGGALQITGTLTLRGDENSIFIFQATSTLITDSASKVILEGNVSPCNVFWQIASSTTLGTGSTLVGTVMAQQSIAAQTGATVQGRLLALNGAVTLDNSTINPGACAGPAAEGGTKPILIDTPKLARTGTDLGLPIIAILTLLGGGVALLMMSGSKARRRRDGQLSE
ncbi:MAG: ice-binding family protein [Terrimesophilobacter sp.]